jgi:hypothetical protein
VDSLALIRVIDELLRKAANEDILRIIIMRLFITIFSTLMVIADFCFSATAFAADEVCGACDKKIINTGQYDHGISDTF